MTLITDHEEDQIAKANESGVTPVVFVHGLWLLPGSWDRWRTLFENAGSSPLPPEWPHDPHTLQEPNPHPQPSAHNPRDRPRAVSGRVAVADLGAEVRSPGAAQSAQPRARGAADLRGVQVRVRQRRRRGRSEGALRHLRGTRLGRAALPGGNRELEP